MKVVQVPFAGGDLELVERPIPEPDAAEVLVCACNTAFGAPRYCAVLTMDW